MLFFAAVSFGQSKSISRFREEFKENSNMFFYSSTLKMLNTENNPELADMLKNIEEIRVLNYDMISRKFSDNDIGKLKKSLQEEHYNHIMMLHESGNSIDLYNKEKHGKAVGFVAVVENGQSVVLIDLIGSIDVKKFMELKQKLDSRKANEN